MTLREISLHILDLMENSVRAGASVISVSITEDSKRNCLEISIEDDGPGMGVSFDAVTNPFYTTKKGERTGLGLSLFRAAAEQAGGNIAIRRSPLGGIEVHAIMDIDHVDRAPLGDIAGTLSGVLCTNPDIDIRFNYRVDGREFSLRSPDIAGDIPPDKRTGIVLSRIALLKMKNGLARIDITA